MVQDNIVGYPGKDLTYTVLRSKMVKVKDQTPTLRQCRTLPHQCRTPRQTPTLLQYPTPHLRFTLARRKPRESQRRVRVSCKALGSQRKVWKCKAQGNQRPYASPNAYSSPVPYTSPALHAPVPYAGSPVPYTKAQGNQRTALEREAQVRCRVLEKSRRLARRTALVHTLRWLPSALQLTRTLRWLSRGLRLASSSNCLTGESQRRVRVSCKALGSQRKVWKCKAQGNQRTALETCTFPLPSNVSNYITNGNSPTSESTSRTDGSLRGF
jgi:hypothetical protein